MTKTEYLAKLTKYLRKLPQKDYEEALEYFMEYFEEAGPENEAQVIAELGTPKEAAHEVITRLLDEKIIEDKSSLRNKTTILCYPSCFSQSSRLTNFTILLSYANDTSYDYFRSHSDCLSSYLCLTH